MLDAEDCAYPHPGQYTTHLVLGYVSGHTAHIWSDSEIAEVASEGRIFLAIATARNNPTTPALTAADGHTDASNMITRLNALNYPKTYPVFYDEEPGIVDTDIAGANAATTAWKADMNAAGWPHAYDYRVLRQGADWVADPTGVRPLTIPSGDVGVQWGGNASFDFDVFVDSILGGSVTSPAQWSSTDDTHVKNIVLSALNEGTASGQSSWASTEQAILGTVQTLINKANAAAGAESSAVNTLSAAIADVKTHVGNVEAALAALPPDATPDQIAQALVPLLPTADAQAVVAALGAAITKGSA